MGAALEQLHVLCIRAPADALLGSAGAPCVA